MNSSLDLDALLYARERGESLIATAANKKPWAKWKRWQTERATEDQIRQWANDNRTVGFAVVTGELSQLVILDFDDADGIRLLERLGLDPHIRTGGGGYHVRLPHPGHPVATQNSEVTRLLHDKWHGLDIRGDGGYAIEWGASNLGTYETLRALDDLVPIDRLPEELAADLRLITAGNGHRPLSASIKVTHPGRHAHLLKIASAMRGRGHEEPAILDELRRVNETECEPPKPDEDVHALAADIAMRYPRGGPSKDVAAQPNGRVDLCRELTRLLKLDAADLEVVGAEIHGQGLTAVAAIHLSNRQAIEVDRFQHLLQPQALNGLVIGSTGLPSVIKGDQCAKIAALVVRIAGAREQLGANDLAREWGHRFLNAAETIDADLSSQAERWAVFHLIDNRQPGILAKAEQTSIAAHSVVIRDPKGFRLVESSWYLTYIRQEVAPIGATELLNRMMRVGWSRRGKRGRWKATNPSRKDQPILLPFYVVPADWETL